jgi:hypothetical protein
MFDDETSEAADLDPIACGQSIHHGIENSIDDDFRIPSRKMREPLVHLIDQIPFCHDISPRITKSISDLSPNERWAGAHCSREGDHS